MKKLYVKLKNHEFLRDGQHVISYATDGYCYIEYPKYIKAPTVYVFTIYFNNPAIESIYLK